MHLIQNRWYVVLSCAELDPARPVGRRRLGLELVFWRDGSGRVAAAVDSCPHRQAKLSPGRIVDGCVECPFHGFRFDVQGDCTLIPAHPERQIPKAMALEMFAVREAHGLVWLWTGPLAVPDDPIPFFDFAGYSWAGSEFTVDVASNYTRGIENQLDFAHLPFVHRTTIGNFVGERFDVITEADNDTIVARTEDPEGRVEFLGPNIWRNKTGPIWQFLAFVPIDDTHMLYYVRSYQRILRVTGLAWIVGLVNRLLNGFIIAQDTSVVESQPTAETRLQDMNEVLVPSDGPIIAYRRWRERHRGPFGVAGARR